MSAAEVAVSGDVPVPAELDAEVYERIVKPLRELCIEEKSSENIERVRALLNKRLEVKVLDGRSFAGRLMCFDKDRNIVLYNTQETRFIDLSSGSSLMPCQCCANAVPMRTM